MPRGKTKKTEFLFDRGSQLRDLFKDVDGAREIIDPLINDVVFLEARMEQLRALPQIQVNANNPAQQKATVAFKQYKECLQQYTNCVKILTGILRKDGEEEESPLRLYLKTRAGNE